MSNKKYYIDEIKLQDEENDLAIGYISCRDHGRCIRIYADNYELTQKLIKIVNALND